MTEETNPQLSIPTRIARRKPFTSPDAMLLDAVLVFYKELGIQPNTIRKIANGPMTRHKEAMRTAAAFLLSEHFDERELQSILGKPKLGAS